MRYFLGYKDGDEYHKIGDNIFNGSIKGILDYTLSFADEVALKDDLYDKDYIPSKMVKLSYLVERKGKLETLNENGKVYTAISSDLFDSYGICKFISCGLKDDDFLNYIFVSILRKYSCHMTIRELLLSNAYNRTNLLKLLRELINISISDECKNSIKKIIDCLDSIEYEQNYLNILIDELIYSITFDKISYINTYKWSKKHISYPKIPTLYHIEALYDGVYNTRKFANSYFETNEMNTNITSLINNFVYSLIYKYDRKNRTYKKDSNGNIEIQEKGLFDLGSILDKYQDYMISTFTSAKATDYVEENDDVEEFLEEEDFERLGTTSTEQGIRLRPREE